MNLTNLGLWNFVKQYGALVVIIGIIVFGGFKVIKESNDLKHPTNYCVIEDLKLGKEVKYKGVDLMVTEFNYYEFKYSKNSMYVVLKEINDNK